MPKSIFVVPLTEYEQAVFDLAIDGLSVKEMADRLYKSHQRIGALLCEIHSKAGVSSRIALVATHYKNELAKAAA